MGEYDEDSSQGEASHPPRKSEYNDTRGKRQFPKQLDEEISVAETLTGDAVHSLTSVP